MLYRNLNNFLRFSSKKILTQKLAFSSTATLPDRVIEEKDPGSYFFNEEIHKMLKIITRPDPEKVFRRRLNEESLEAPLYKFMTEEDLQKAYKESEIKMNELLQMPPVVKSRNETGKVINRDPYIECFDESKWVFTDISFGVKNKDRIIVVREPDGTLRYADSSEKKRLNQVYFPLVGREVERPRMFLEENLKAVLERGDYEFILDRCCVQFDPDDPEFHEFTGKVYDYINNEQHYDKLLSTRHYGPMVFYLAWNKNIDNLLQYYLDNEKLEDSVMLVQIYYAVNVEIPNKIKNDGDNIKFINHYIENHSANKRKTSQSLRMFMEIVNAKKEMEEAIKKADGKSSEQ